MKVILLTDVADAGQRGDVVEVKDGFGRNYLIQKGLGRIADDRAIREAALKKAAREKKGEARKEYQKEYQEKLGAAELLISKKANSKGSLFAGVTASEIQEILVKRGFEFIRESEIEGCPIKTVGESLLHIRVGNKVVPVRLRVSAL